MERKLAAISSVVDATQCAIEIQRELRSRNAALVDSRRMQFRIGINLGDVIVEQQRLYGDGVNIAARVESLAQGGGVCLSGTAYDQVEGKLPFGYDFPGEQIVKNIARPVRVYRLRLEPGASPVSLHGERRAGRRRMLGVAGAIVFLILLGAGGWAGWRWLGTPASSGLALPDKPSVAVLPFTNLSRDPAQEYFSDGVTEDLITGLSKISGLFVIARNSAFTYKGKAVKVGDVARDLGVRYVLEGGVQRAGSRVRITAQLVDATTGYHTWAERYDREVRDIFALQDEVTQQIVRALAVRLTEGEEGRMGRTPTADLEAYDLVLRGQDERKRTTREANIESRRLFVKALDLDPDYAQAYAGLSWAHLNSWQFMWSTDRRVWSGRGSWRREPSRWMARWPRATVSSARSICGRKSTIGRSPRRSARSQSPPTTPTRTRLSPRCWGGQAGRRRASSSSGRPCAWTRTIPSSTCGPSGTPTTWPGVTGMPWIRSTWSCSRIPISSRLTPTSPCCSPRWAR